MLSKICFPSTWNVFEYLGLKGSKVIDLKLGNVFLVKAKVVFSKKPVPYQLSLHREAFGPEPANVPILDFKILSVFTLGQISIEEFHSIWIELKAKFIQLR